MPRRIEYKAGDQVGYLEFVKDSNPDISISGIKRRTAIFKCKHCGNEFRRRLHEVKNLKIKSCGCATGEMIAKSKITHGQTNTKLYYVWSNMRDRCNRKSCSYYKWYGKRGIKVCDEWDKSFYSFYNWANKNGYAEGLTIDRINNDGNYEPSNCRWVTHQENINNQSELRSTNSSGYKRISVKSTGKFEVTYKGKYVGSYSTIEDAVKARDKYESKLRRECA